MAVVPAAARAPASGAARAAMLKPASSMAADHSAATELLKSKAAVNALHKARQDAPPISAKAIAAGAGIRHLS